MHLMNPEHTQGTTKKSKWTSEAFSVKRKMTSENQQPVLLNAVKK